MTNSSFNYNDWADKICAYISSKMTDIDRQEFEVQMAQIPELQEAVDFDTLLKKQAQEHFYEEYINTNWDDIMSDVSSENTDNKTPEKPTTNIDTPPTNPVKPPLSIKGILGGLGVLALLVSAYFIYQNQAKNAKLSRIEQLQDVWFAPITFENDNIQEKATDMFKNGLYEQAETVFFEADTIKNKNDDVGAYGLYRAMNALTIKPPKSDLAFKILEKRYNKGNLPFKPEVTKWFLIKVYLQKKDYANAQLMLEKMTQEDLSKIPNAKQYSSEILDLLKDL